MPSKDRPCALPDKVLPFNRTVNQLGSTLLPERTSIGGKFFLFQGRYYSDLIMRLSPMSLSAISTIAMIMKTCIAEAAAMTNCPP